VLHRNFIGDEFLGQVSIPLAEFDVYDKPKNKWYELKSKPGQEKKNKYRGEIEVKVNFTVQSGVSSAASLADLKKKDGIRGSFGTLSQKMGTYFKILSRNHCIEIIYQAIFLLKV